VQAPTARVAARAPVAEEAPRSPQVVLPEAPSAAGDPGSGGGSPARVDAPASPRVVVGNGRVPGEGSIDRLEPPAVHEPAMPSDGVLPAARVPVNVPATAPQPAPSRPVDQSSEMVTPLFTAPPATGAVGAMWGLAGLIVAPLAGIWLGYRQARANKAADQLNSSLAGG
jgi:hypothetical protein